MAVQTSLEEINCFLVEVKSLITEGKYDFIPRPKNNLTNLGINLKIALDIILNLTYKNYFNGPEEDDNPKFIGFIWEFGKDEDQYQIYIKLKLKDTSRGKLLCIMGFHKADFPIRYLYK
ncbi:putative toxin-antitoxin system, toxin component [Clostridiales bacterium oral taxon 876 str. F0540]|nr:putative toxin-antitoxin system, toxin component [Clostridiales bacterium oral taxon 876 str. F0540]